MHEWPLLIFTICIQTAIGGMLMVWIFNLTMKKIGEENVFALLKTPLLVIAALALIGLASSFAHLGTPSNAFNAIRNLGSSWMSREILVTSLFIGAVMVTLGLALTQRKINGGLLFLTAIIGLVDVYVMSAMYRFSLVSGWDSINTVTSFYGTALVLGPVLVTSLVIPALSKYQKSQDETAVAVVEPMQNTQLQSEREVNVTAQILGKYAFYVAAIGIGIQLVGLAVFGTTMPEINMIQGASGLSALEGYQSMVVLRWVIELAGLGFLGYLVMSPKMKFSPTYAYAILVVLLVAEGMSRYVFYVLGT